MSVSLSQGQTNVLACLRAFLLGILPAGVEVVRGQDNRVPEPLSPDFVKLTPLGQARLGTNFESFQDLYADGIADGFRSITEPTQFTIQCDFHGPNSTDNLQLFTTLFRDSYACDAFAAFTFAGPDLAALPGGGTTVDDESGFAIMTSSAISAQPLYTSEPRQVPFVNGEGQYEYRWSVDAEIQINPVVNITQDFAAALKVGLISVDEQYPPENTA